MIQDNQKNFSRLQMLIDAIVIAVTYVLAWMIRFIGPFAYSAVRALAFEEYMFALIFIIPGYLLLYQAFTLYEPLHMQGRRLVLANIIKANVLGLLLIVFSLYMMGESDFSRLTVYIFCVINIFAEWGVRLFIFSMLRKMRKRGLNQKQMILVGYSRAAEEYIDRIQQNPQWGYVVRGILDDNVPAGTVYNGIKVIGRIANLSVILPANRLDEIAITLGLSEYYRLLLIVFSLYMMGESDFSRLTVYIFCVINIFAEWGVRLFIFSMLRKMRKRGLNQKQMILVGYSRAAEEYIDRIQQNPQWGYVVRGILDDNVPAGTVYNGIKVIGRIANLSVILPANRLDEIAITLGLSEYYRLEEIVGMCEKSGVHTKFIPDYNKIIPTKPYTEDILGLPVINIRYVPLSNTFNAMVKRLMDVVGAIMAIIVSSPVMLLMCILIKLTSPGPLIYRQERVGLHNKNFWMYKFRSMEIQPEAEEKKAWTVKNDPRVTGIGKFMRRTSIDELPQLFNILKGDMSLVGPRPERPFFVEKFREEIPRYMVKHQVRPGLTGWAQVNGYRGDTSIRKRIDCDLYYIENWSIGFDIKILFLTIFKGFINKNAY